MSNVTINTEDNTVIIETGVAGPSGQGVPVGGTTGQFLKKTSDSDFDTEWSDTSASVNSLNDINDVTITTPSSGEVLKWNGVAWVNGTDSGDDAVWGNITGTLSNQTDLQSALDGKSDTTHNHDSDYAALSHTHVMADITDSTWISDYTVTEGDVTAHQSALTITESQISDLGSYLTDAPSDGNEYLRKDGAWALVTTGGGGATTFVELTDTPANFTSQGGKVLAVNVAEDAIEFIDAPNSAVWGNITGTLSDQTDLQSALDGKSDTGHDHSGVYEPADATILKDADIGVNVAAQSHTHVMADITDSTWISDYTVTEGDVTAHQAALTITESQISDLGSYITGIAWGDVTGTLSNQTDLQGALDAKSDATHNHDGDYATTAQGALADSAVQPSDNISTLTNDSAFIAHAPSDGNEYVSKNGSWVVNTGAGGPTGPGVDIDLGTIASPNNATMDCGSFV